MRIVQLTRDFPPAPSGIGDHVARVCRELAAAGDDVVAVCSPPADPLAGIDVRPVVERWDANGASFIARAVAATEPDAIVWHYNPFQIGAHGLALRTAPRLARALARVAPLVVVLHELWYPWGRSGLRGLAWASGQRLQIRGVIAAAAKIVVTTERRAARLRSAHPRRAGDISVVAAGATVEPSGLAIPRARFGISDSAFVVAHLGAIGEGRDLSPALAAIDALVAGGTDARLLLAGRTGVAPPAHPRVVATGPLPHAELSGALALADVYLFAEPTGPVARKTSLLSALAHGLPLLAYSGPAEDPEFRDGEDLLLVEPSDGAVTAALGRLAADPALRARLGEAGRTTFERRFSWRSIAEGIRGAAIASMKGTR